MYINKNTVRYFKFVFVAMTLAVVACSKPTVSDSSSSSTTPTPTPNNTKYLYVSSGACYVGNLTATQTTANTGSGLIEKIDLTTGQPVGMPVVDYNQRQIGDWPASLVDYDSNYFLALVENSGARRVEKISKSTGDSIFYYYGSIFSSQLRSLFRNSDGSLLVSRSTAVEKLGGSPFVRIVPSGAAANTPWMTNPAGACTTSATLITSVIPISNGMVIYAHANAAQNKIGIIAGTGYVAAADCKSGLAAPNANSFPTSMVYKADTKHLIVSYASSTTAADNIYVYDVDETTGVISNGTKASQAADENINIRGVSSMYWDSTNSELYVANGSTTLANSIEKFTFDSTTRLLTRVGSSPFSPTTIYHKCITSMMIAN